MKYNWTILVLCIILLTGCQDLESMMGNYKVATITGTVVEQQGITLNLAMNDGQNTISGNNSCNEYNGNFEVVEDQVINIGPLMASKMYCQETADLEKRYMTQLALVHKAKMRDGVLQLMDQEGNVIITAKRIDE